MPKPSAPLSDADRKVMQDAARAQIEKRQRAGTWSGGVVPHYEYQTRPLDWMIDKLAAREETLRWSLNPEYATHSWDGDRDGLVAALEALANGEDVGIESATGIGKTRLGAYVTLWFIACFENAIVSTIAPKEDQLLKHIWKEIGILWPLFQKHFPDAELLPGSGTLRMKPQEAGRETWAASAFVCGVGASEEVAVKAQGLHAEHLLLITEETPGIDAAIMKALFNTRTDDHNLHLALGNPDHQQDELHHFCLMPGVRHLRISALDHPNIVTSRRVVPGAIGQRRLELRTEELGVGSRLYDSRVRGISPAEAEDALIRREWCEAAAKRWGDPELRKGELALGVDPADKKTGDAAAIAHWQGACLTEVRSYQVGDASEVADLVAIQVRHPDHPVEPRYVGVDSVGIGASTVNTLKRMGIKVRNVSGGTRAVPRVDEDTLWSETEEDLDGRVRPKGPTVVDVEQFDNTRSQVWWVMREDLRLGRIALPDDKELFEDLCAPKWQTKNGKISVEPKPQVKQRLRRSPNKGDAACYGNFVRRRTPARREAARATVPERSRNRDTGLERLLAKHHERQQRDRRAFERMLRKHRGRR